MAAYTADQSKPERASVQDAFFHGALRVVFATTAFGMGVDKRDIRWVIHWGMPQSIQTYYQMIGRAGRDMEPANCLMLWSAADVAKRQYIHRSESYRHVPE